MIGEVYIMQKENKMGVMPIPKLVISMSLPIMISMLVQSLYNIVDSIFIAQISENALTAVSIAYSAQVLQIAVAVGIGVGVNALVSRRLGAKQNDQANEAATTGLFITVLGSLIFVLWGIFGTKTFIRQFSADQEIIDAGTAYLRICQIFATGIFLGTFAQRLLQAAGKTFLSMLAQLAGAIVNIILDAVLIFGLLGFPVMGIEGAAIATVIGQWVAAILGFLLNYIQNKEIHFVFRGYHMNRESVLTICKVGAPTILTQACGSIMVAVMNIILVTFSSTAVASFGICFRLQNFLLMPLMGLGQGALPIVGYNYGAKNKERIMGAMKSAVSAGVGIALAATVIFLVFPKQLLLLFAANEDMLEIGIPALRIISITFALSAVTIVIGYMIIGLGNGMVNMIGTALRQLIVVIPFVILFGKAGGVSKVWYAYWISELTACLYAVFSLKSILRHKLD